MCVCLLTMYILGMWQLTGLCTIPDCVIDLFEFTTERKSTRFYDVIELKSTNKGLQFKQNTFSDSQADEQVYM